MNKKMMFVMLCLGFFFTTEVLSAARNTYSQPRSTRNTNSQAYSKSYGNSYGKSYGNSYGKSYGNSYGKSYGNSYGKSYGNSYGKSYGNSYGKSYGTVPSYKSRPPNYKPPRISDYTAPKSQTSISNKFNSRGLANIKSLSAQLDRPAANFRPNLGEKRKIFVPKSTSNKGNTSTPNWSKYTDDVTYDNNRHYDSGPDGPSGGDKNLLSKVFNEAANPKDGGKLDDDDPPPPGGGSIENDDNASFNFKPPFKSPEYGF